MHSEAPTTGRRPFKMLFKKQIIVVEAHWKHLVFKIYLNLHDQSLTVIVLMLKNYTVTKHKENLVTLYQERHVATLRWHHVNCSTIIVKSWQNR